MLVNGDDKDLAVIRAAVVVQAGGMNVLQPHHLPDEKLTPFLRGYAEKLVTLAQQESG
jgi:hypothetical protein